MSFIWATRGRNWGFRFLRRGGHPDPLPAYDEVFSAVDDEPEICLRIGDRVALRFSDPLQRTDAAGRVIAHEFVIGGSPAEGIDSVEAARALVWPEVADEFDEAYQRDKPPATR